MVHVLIPLTNSLAMFQVLFGRCQYSYGSIGRLSNTFFTFHVNGSLNHINYLIDFNLISFRLLQSNQGSVLEPTLCLIYTSDLTSRN